MESILDKVMENKQAEDLLLFDPQGALGAILAALNEREQQVLIGRFGLSGNNAETLESIGKKFNVTRERVRQIETSSIKKLKRADTLVQPLKSVESVVNQILTKHGGVMQHDHLLDSILINHENNSINRSIIHFFVDKLLDHRYTKLKNAKEYHQSWKLVTVEDEEALQLVSKLIALIDAHGEPIHEADLIAKCVLSTDGSIDHCHIQSRLRLAKSLKQNIFGQWGRADWSNISPKRMNDKVYLVLKHVGEPMHFTDIANKINELKFDHKTAYPATVHNELILDKKFVLVGRGIYALSEWGYEPGVVADVISRVLHESTNALTREEIVEKVLEQRLVSKSTIHLALMNKDKFKKADDGRYTIILQPQM